LHVVRDVVEVKVLDMVVTTATSHVSTPVPVNFDAPLNVFSSVTTFLTFHPFRSAFISLAWQKVQDRVVVEEVSHEAKPVPVNLDAPLNVLLSVTTFPTFHPVRSEFISPAPLKV
jgi:hypothetical protein